MKVPIRYKSSDHYNAGVDVVYDDESKLQYAPFIYAGVEAGSQDDGGDEEGEDFMVVNFNSTDNTLDKTYTEIKEALTSGKFAYICNNLKIGTDEELKVYYITSAYTDQGVYFVTAHDIIDNTSMTFSSTTADGVLTQETA